MDTMTITIESDSGTRMKFLVHHEPHFDLRSEEVDRLETTVRTVENTITKEDDVSNVGQAGDDLSPASSARGGSMGQQPLARPITYSWLPGD